MLKFAPSLFIALSLFTTAYADLKHGMVTVKENQHTFSVDRYELTWQQWRTVRQWALLHGYDFSPAKAQDDAYPAATMTWYDAVKFCNAASEMVGRKPVYYLDSTHNQVYRQNDIDLVDSCMNRQANGYRLPNSSEWQAACRAGTQTLYYWGDTADPLNNPYAWHTGHTAKDANVTPHPVGLKQPNALGLYDISGNVAEWCSDLYMDKAAWRVQRGGSVSLDSNITSDFVGCARPDYRAYDLGMRLFSSDPNCPALRDQLTRPTDESVTQPLTPRYDGSNPQAVAKRLFGLLNTDDQNLQQALKLYLQGEYQPALDAYRDAFVGRIKQHLNGTGYKLNGRFWSGPSKEDIQQFLCDAGSIHWFSTLENKNNPYHPGYFHNACSLIVQWQKQNNPDYLKQWFAIAQAFACRAKTDFDNLTPEELALPTYYGVPQTWTFGMGFTEYTLEYYEVLSRIIASLSKDQIQIIPSMELANILIFCATDDASKTLKDPRDCVSNQQLTMARSLLHLSIIQEDFSDARAWYKLGAKRIQSGALNYMILPDGGDREQSFNYNSGLYHFYLSLADLFNGRQFPDWLLEFRKRALWRKRMFASIRLASGVYPTVGNNSYGRNLNTVAYPNDPLYEPLQDQILDRMLYNSVQQLPAPAFTSIAFPYSGYYVQRNGWDDGCSSLFIKCSSPTVGHGHPDNNAIELVAYGKHLLVGRESPPYVPIHLTEKLRRDYPWILEYKQENAIWMENNILIDGCGQVLGNSDQRQKQSVIPGSLWYTSDSFDFTQGLLNRPFHSSPGIEESEVRKYASEYGATDVERSNMLAAAEKLNTVPQQLFDATHIRQVIYLRKANAWLLVDYAQRHDRANNAPDQITQLWHLPSPNLNTKHASLGKKYNGYNPLRPGFTLEHVTCDTQHNTILTHNPDNVNMAIISVMPGKMQYKTYYGDKYPYRGWANGAPSMVSDYVPAVDIHATVAIGKMPLVTLLVPIPQGKTLEDRLKTFTQSNDQSIIQCSAGFDDGTRINFAIASQSCQLPLGKQKVQGTMALLIEASQAQPQGMVMQGQQKAYAFTLENDQIKTSTTITAPTDFKWEKSADSLIPVYH